MDALDSLIAALPGGTVSTHHGELAVHAREDVGHDFDGLVGAGDDALVVGGVEGVDDGFRGLADGPLDGGVGGVGRAHSERGGADFAQVAHQRLDRSPLWRHRTPTRR